MMYRTDEGAVTSWSVSEHHSWSVQLSRWKQRQISLQISDNPRPSTECLLRSRSLLISTMDHFIIIHQCLLNLLHLTWVVSTIRQWKSGVKLVTERRQDVTVQIEMNQCCCLCWHEYNVLSSRTSLCSMETAAGQGDWSFNQQVTQAVVQGPSEDVWGSRTGSCTPPWCRGSVVVVPLLSTGGARIHKTTVP